MLFTSVTICYEIRYWLTFLFRVIRGWHMTTWVLIGSSFFIGRANPQVSSTFNLLGWSILEKHWVSIFAFSVSLLVRSFNRHTICGTRLPILFSEVEYLARTLAILSLPQYTPSALLGHMLVDCISFLIVHPSNLAMCLLLIILLLVSFAVLWLGWLSAFLLAWVFVIDYHGRIRLLVKLIHECNLRFTWRCL